MKSNECTILFAEDDPVANKLYSSLFKAEGFQVVTCTSAPQVMAELGDKAQKIDILVTDLEMPEGNTLDLFPYLKDKHPNLPVIVVTGHYEGLADSFAKKGFKIAGFYNKPVDAKALSVKIRQILKVEAKN